MAVAVSKRGSETLPMSLGATGKVGKGGGESMEERKREGWKVGGNQKVSVKQGRGADSQSMLLGSFLSKRTAIL